MTKLRLLLGMGALLALGLTGSAAFGAAPGAGTCSGGAIAAGTYNGFTVTGNCTFAGGPITINGNLKIEDGAFLNDHAATYANVHVTGNVMVGKGSVLGLGNYSEAPSHNSATVDGNIIANQPLTLYLGGITVHGNLISNGGGPGLAGPFRNFPSKDDTIDGNLIIQGWQGGWAGVIRTTVGGNLIYSKNASVVDPDSNEVQTNVISGNLICQGNTPPAQVNPAEGGQPNVVGGQKIGQCAGL
jgi:hypothetical protein